jgi:hypothetical protein
MIIIGCDFHTRYQQIGGWRAFNPLNREGVPHPLWFSKGARFVFFSFNGIDLSQRISLTMR